MKKEILFTSLLLGGVSLLYAGHLDLRIPNNANKKQASVVKSADTTANVTYAQIKQDLEDVGTAIDAIDMSTIDPAVFTGTQKTCIQNLKSALSSLKTASRNLMQADNKLVKKMKAEKEIDDSFGVK